MCVAEVEPRHKNTRHLTQNTGWSTERHGEAVQVTLLFLMLLAVFLGRAIFPGEKLVPGDINSSDPAYSGYADYVFRAVYLRAGQHTVEWAYAPRSPALALPVSLAPALSLLILLASPTPHTTPDGVPRLWQVWVRVTRPLRQIREKVGHGAP